MITTNIISLDEVKSEKLIVTSRVGPFGLLKYFYGIEGKIYFTK